jgi:aryl-alcohol dehydrogenase-like predicted oxidoreductase
MGGTSTHCDLSTRDATGWLHDGSGTITGYAEISAEPNLFKKIHAITDSTESAQELLNILSVHESEGVLETALYQGTTLEAAEKLCYGRLCNQGLTSIRPMKPIK